jgi:hypothetical protein
MELKLAKVELTSKPKSIKLDKIKAIIEKNSQAIFHFDNENSHKDLTFLAEHFEGEGYSVYLREVKYGLDDNDFIYEMHIL